MTRDQGVLIAVLVARVMTDAGAKRVLGDPVRIWDQPPMGLAFPYVQIGRCDSRPVRGQGEAVEHLLSLICVSQFAGMEEARAVAAVVEAALDGLVGEVAGVVSCQVRAVEVTKSTDMKRALAVMRVRAVTDGVAELN